MATDNRWISVDNIIKSAMIDMGDSTNTNYQKFLSFIIRGVNELGYDVFKRFKEVLLKVDSSTYTAKLPDDYVSQVRVGLINTNGEYLPFTYNPNIVFDVEVPACHCDCGCCDEVCESLQDGVYEETSVEISTQTKTCNYRVSMKFVNSYVGICSNPAYPSTVISISVEGSLSTINTVVNNSDEYNALIALYTGGLPVSYVITRNDGICTRTLSSSSIAFPLTINSYVKNGVTVTDGTVIANDAALDTYFSNLGWTKAATDTYTKTGTADVWGQFNITNSAIVYTQYVTESSCNVATANVTHTNTCKTCVDDNGNITKECCTWGYDIEPAECNYSITLLDKDIGTFSFPMTDGVLVKDGVSINLPTLASNIELEDFLITYGFSITDPTNLTMRVRSSSTFTTLSSAIDAVELTFTQTACDNGRTVINKCIVEHLCEAEVLPECSCIVVTDAIVDVLTTNSILENQAYNRWKRSGSILQTYATAGNVLGYYNINKENNVIYFNAGMPRKAVYLQYYSANEVDSGDFLVPVQAQETLIAYLDYKSKWSKSNVPMYEKQRAEKYWYNEKTKLKARLNPILMSEIQDILRTAPSQRP